MQKQGEGGILFFTPLGNVDGRTLWHHRTCPPVPMVSPRSSICSWYTIEEGDSFIFMTSSLGNELFTKQNAKLLGSDVVAESTMNYFEIRQAKDGVDATQILVARSNGWTPNFAIRMMATAWGKILPNIEKFLLE